MDRRTIIAMGVIVLIFITLPYYWEWIGFSPNKDDQPAGIDSTVVDTAPSERPQEWVREEPTSRESEDLELSKQSQEGESRLDSIPEQFYDVETELFSARLSSRGGSFASFRLKKYDYSSGDHIELVPRRDEYPLVFGYPEAGGLTSSDIHFDADRKSLSLTASGPDSALLTLSGTTPEGAPVRIVYTFRRDSYRIGLRIETSRTAELSGVTRLDVGWRGGLDATEDNRSEDYGYFSAYVRQGGEVAKFDDFDDARLREGSSGSVSWIATKSKYFLVALRRVDDLAEDFEISAVERKLVEQGNEVAKRVFDIRMGNRLTAGSRPEFELYLGPVDYAQLSKVGHDLDRTIEMGFWLFRPFAIAILWFLTTLHGVIPNYGWVIMVFTVAIKVVFYPFSRKNYQQMARMKAMQPRLKEIQTKYKEQPQELNKRMMKLYKEEKFNPFGGCLWMLPQLPVFWALFTVFRSSIDLRGAQFLWLHDLSQPSILLAVIMAAAMLLQQLLTNKDPKQRFMVYGLPVIMFFLFRNFPAGLVLYWTVYNILSIVEQKSVERSMVPVAVGPTSSGSAPSPRKSLKK